MKQRTLYLIITILFGILIIASVFAITMVIRNALNQNLIENYAAQEQVIANNISSTLESDIQSTKNLLIAMSRNELIQTGATEPCTKKIKEIVDSVSVRLGNVGRVDSKGLFKCSLNSALIGSVASNLGPYITDIFSDPEHKPVMSRAIAVPNVEGRVAAVHVPVWKGDEFDGTLGGAIYFKDLEQKYLTDVVVAQRGFVALFDDDGTVLYHRHPELIGKTISSPEYLSFVGDPKPFEEMIAESKNGKGGLKRYINVTEGEKVAAFEPIMVLPGRTWMVLVTVPIGDVHADLAQIGVTTLLTSIWVLTALFVIIGLAAFVWLSIQFVFKPIKQIQEMKSDFVSLVSHQLKTPVAQIKGYVENMLDGLTGPINEKQKEYLRDMLNVAIKNSKLIDDLLNVSRIERRMLKVNVEALELTELLNDVLSPLRLVASKKGVILEEHLPQEKVVIIGDGVKTREALRNIVDNALKFTQAGKKVTVSAKPVSEGAEVTIQDEGEGIDVDVQNELFEKNRVWAGKVKASGAGLGLFLSKQFIELSGGTITFVSTQGKGTTFIINFRKQ